MAGHISFPVRKEHQESDDPPPYHASTSGAATPQSFPPHVITEMTTVTTTRTTRTTTQLFSLPVWRRRPGTPRQKDSLSVSGFGGAVGEDGKILRSISLNLDKDLPAVPGVESGQEAGPSRLPYHGPFGIPAPSASRQSVLNNLDFVDSPPSSRKNSFASQSHPTRVLAQAALGLGLPHVMPEAAQPLMNAVPVSDLRRAKSFTRSRSGDATSALHNNGKDATSSKFRRPSSSRGHWYWRIGSLESRWRKRFRPSSFDEKAFVLES